MSVHYSLLARTSPHRHQQVLLAQVQMELLLRPAPRLQLPATPLRSAMCIHYKIWSLCHPPTCCAPRPFQAPTVRQLHSLRLPLLEQSLCWTLKVVPGYLLTSLRSEMCVHYWSWTPPPSPPPSPPSPPQPQASQQVSLRLHQEPSLCLPLPARIAILTRERVILVQYVWKRSETIGHWESTWRRSTHQGERGLNFRAFDIFFKISLQSLFNVGSWKYHLISSDYLNFNPEGGSKAPVNICLIRAREVPTATRHTAHNTTGICTRILVSGTRPRKMLDSWDFGAQSLSDYQGLFSSVGQLNWIRKLCFPCD